MILPAFLFCQVSGGAVGCDLVTIDEPALLRAISGELKDRGKARIRSLGGYSPAAFPVYLKYLNEDPLLQHCSLMLPARHSFLGSL